MNYLLEIIGHFGHTYNKLILCMNKHFLYNYSSINYKIYDDRLPYISVSGNLLISKMTEDSGNFGKLPVALQPCVCMHVCVHVCLCVCVYERGRERLFNMSSMSRPAIAPLPHNSHNKLYLLVISINWCQSAGKRSCVV